MDYTARRLTQGLIQSQGENLYIVVFSQQNKKHKAVLQRFILKGEL